MRFVITSLPERLRDVKYNLFHRRPTLSSVLAMSNNQASSAYIPHADINWVRKQKSTVIQLFWECWTADPYGSDWMQLTTRLKRSAFREAKKKLVTQALFVFKPEKSIQDGRSTVCWMIKNLHGSRVYEFWGMTEAELDAYVPPQDS